jgi:hypothetical protein
MSRGSPPDGLHRRRPDLVFGLFLASGVTVGAYCLWAIADWIHSQGEGAFGLFYLGAFSFVPVLLAWLAGGIHMLMGSTNRDVRLGVGLTTAHLVWWLIVVGIELARDNPSWGWVMRIATIVEPSLYSVAVTVLAARWFWRRRRPEPLTRLCEDVKHAGEAEGHLGGHDERAPGMRPPQILLRELTDGCAAHCNRRNPLQVDKLGIVDLEVGIGPQAFLGRQHVGVS